MRRGSGGKGKRVSCFYDLISYLEYMSGCELSTHTYKFRYEAQHI